jgi:IS6 family transposase
VWDLLAERAIKVDAFTIHWCVRKFGPEIAKRSFKHRSWLGLNRHVCETYIRLGGKWRYLWRAVDQQGWLVDFRLTVRRDVKAASAFLKPECENARLYQPRSITKDKTHSYDRVIGDMNRFELISEGILHINRKWGNNRIEGDRAALKELIILIKLMCGFRSLTSAKATLRGIEAI